MIARGKLQAAKTLSKAINAIPYPEDIYQMRSFLRPSNVYRRFVPGFAKIAIALNKKIEKGESSQFFLDDQKRRAVNELKNRHYSSPVFALLHTKGQYTVDTGALDTQIGFVLLQEQEEEVLK